METFVVRVWLPDRPGALGAVASRIGAVRGDVVAIDILERGNGRALDELVVQLPDASLLDLLVGEVNAVDGAAVEDVRPAPDALCDPRLDALETAAMLVGAATLEELRRSFVQHVVGGFGADWVALVDLGTPAVLASEGTVPTLAWLVAFVDGNRSSTQVEAGESGPEDVAWAPMPTSGLSVVVGRSGRPLRARERRQLAALARIADSRWPELRLQATRLARPSVEG